MRIWKRFSTVLAAATAVSILATAQAASAGVNQTSARAYASARDRTEKQVAFTVRSYQHSLSADTTATAKGSHCTGCFAVAIAVEVNLVGNLSGSLTQRTIAHATSSKCKDCTVVAAAHSFAVALTKGTPCLTSQGKADLDAIRRQFRALSADTGLNGAMLQSRIDDLMGQVASTLLNNLWASAGSSCDRDADSGHGGPELHEHGGSTHTSRPDEDHTAKT